MSTFLEEEECLRASLDIPSHIKYFKSILRVMPEPYTSLDTSRLTALYFSVVGLDILGALDTLNKQEISEFIYMMHLRPAFKSKDAVYTGQNGFIGGNSMNHIICGFCNDKGTLTAEPNIPQVISSISSSCCNSPLSVHSDYHQGHIAMTYTSLVTLITLGDDLSRVDKESVIRGKVQYTLKHILL